ncbi:unnamed protein product [Chondrus crispus]|uniref:Tr-type G domain-containing protein n=1 Tax=Chondrus crispus TaxID=2769 RepID=R7QCB6_CHOCR|nr:unnamed protein product [Chondrus crispus]CDF35719.1 unnamed protein product [Chondrus crispus]|eukprot:XP_005715538.1 unnamed protein product [Chondrus crispus]
MQVMFSQLRTLRLLQATTRRFLSAQPSVATSLTEARNPSLLRNAAIIAHVDHGKSTLCDKILRDCSVEVSEDRMMDSGDLERERGITITSKVTTVEYKDYLLNIVDSPGHSDFGGEVERILGMVDSAVLLVDATEGPMAQTKFVLSKALALNLKPIVVLNKIDRPSARPEAVESDLFDLFASLDASEEQLDFTTVYASAKEGWASMDPNSGRDMGMIPLLEKIVDLVPCPKVSLDEPFSFIITMLSRDPFLGRIATGRVCSGIATVGDPVHVVSRDGVRRKNAKITKIMASRGLKRQDIPVASAGDITANAADCNNLSIPTIKPLWAPAIDPPTVSITFNVNDSPLSGKEGEVLTTQKLADWLYAEAENNVSIAVEKDAESDGLQVKGRGELQLGILVETLRREGAELALSPPKILTKLDNEGNLVEPVEELHIEVDDDHTGAIIEKLSARQANLIDMKPVLGDRTKLSFLCPSRGLLGYRPIFIQDTRGTGIMNRIFAEWAPRKATQSSVSTRKGVLVSMASGMTAGHALAALEARGVLFVGPREPVYTGMIIGEHNRDMDIDVNPVKAKQLTNFRTQSKDENVRLAPHRQYSLETAISYVSEAELVEVTPKSVRMRKQILDPGLRARKLKK